MKKFRIDWDFVGGFLCCILLMVIAWAWLWVVYP